MKVFQHLGFSRVSFALLFSVWVLSCFACFGGDATPATVFDDRGFGNPASELYAPGNRPLKAYSFEIPPLAEPADALPVALSDYADGPTLVVFWADWCVYCRHELPELQELYQACFEPNGIGMVGVVVEHEDPLPDAVANAAAFAEGHGFTFESGFDYDDRVARRYLPLVGTPSYVFVDAEGMVAGVSVGARGTELLRGSMMVLAMEQRPRSDFVGC